MKSKTIDIILGTCSLVLTALFLIAFLRCFTGIGFTLFALFTSMFWFPAPESVSPKVHEFLSMEMAYLHGSWDISRVLFTLTIPVSLFLLAYALWNRAIWAGLLVVVLMAFIKIFWSILEGGESGTSILIPALTGLTAGLALIFIGYRILGKRK